LSGSNGPGAPADWGRWFRHLNVDVQSGDIVMEGVRERPLLILDRVGEGRVAQLMSDHAWLWARGYEGGGPQAELMRRVAHWLMKEPELEEEALRARVEGDQLVVERRSLETELPPVEVTKPDGSTETLRLEPGADGRARTRTEVDQLGTYELSDGTRTAVAAAGPPNPLEYRDVRATRARLNPLVDASGGAHVRIADGVPRLRKVDPERDSAGRGWIGLDANRDYRVAGVMEVPLLPAILALILVLATLIAAWFREGK
jgi:hypothetical protein